MRFGAIIVLFFLGAFAAHGQEDLELAARYSPVFHQFIGHHPRADLLAALDYDGDLNTLNNWEHLDNYPLLGTIYYSVVSTRTHWFLTYVVFHPRDYARFCTLEICHENDLEGLKLTVQRDGSPWGRLRLVEAIAHAHILAYATSPEVQGKQGALLPPPLLEDGHPMMTIEAEGHGVRAVTHPEQISSSRRLVYRFDDTSPVEPSWPEEREATYTLVPIATLLWATLQLPIHLPTLTNFFTYTHPFLGLPMLLPGSLRGDNYSDNRANLPWYWTYYKDKLLPKGAWFLDPALNLLKRFSLPEEVARTYEDNVFLAPVP